MKNFNPKQSKKEYAGKLTKEMLTEIYKIESVSYDGYVYQKDEKTTKFNGWKIPKKSSNSKYFYVSLRNFKTNETNTIHLQRIMFAWFHGEIPAGYVIDHINDKTDKIEDYFLDNLSLKTPYQNLAKSHPEYGTGKYKKPKKFENLTLAQLKALYDEADRQYQAAKRLPVYCKKDQIDRGKKVHSLRCNRARFASWVREMEKSENEKKNI